MANDAGELMERKLRKEAHIIGGHAGRSDRDTLGDGVDNLARRPGEIGAPTSADFASAFHKGKPGLGDMLPAGVGNAPEVGGDVGNKTPVNNSVSNTERAGSAISDAAKNVGAATGALQSTAQNLAGQTAALNAVAAALRGLGTDLNSAMQNLRSDVTELQSELANLRGY